MLRLLTVVAGVALESQFFWISGVTGISVADQFVIGRLPAVATHRHRNDKLKTSLRPRPGAIQSLESAVSEAVSEEEKKEMVSATQDIPNRHGPPSVICRQPKLQTGLIQQSTEIVDASSHPEPWFWHAAKF